MRMYRRERGLSLQALGDLVGVTKVTISCIERGIQSPSLSLMQKLIDKTDLKAEDFLRQEEAAE